MFYFRSRSSRPEVFCRKGVLRNFAKFTGKHLCQSLFLNKVAGLKPRSDERQNGFKGLKLKRCKRPSTIIFRPN